jgi:hypothetical protein
MKITTQTPVCAPAPLPLHPRLFRSVNCPEHVLVGLERVTPRITCDYMW